MKLLYWNCQGLATPLTVQNLRALVAREKPNVMFLMETKNRETVIQRLRKRLNFQNFFIVNPVGIAGGLAVLWEELIALHVDSASNEMINLIWADSVMGNQMCITFVHAPNAYHERLELWEELKRISAQNELPWVEVLYHWEKVGKRIVEPYRLNAFRDCLNECSLTDIECKGCAFTCANNREGGNYVKKETRQSCKQFWMEVQIPRSWSLCSPSHWKRP